MLIKGIGYSILIIVWFAWGYRCGMRHGYTKAQEIVTGLMKERQDEKEQG